MHARRQTNCRSSEFSPAARARVALVPNDSAVRVTLPICTDSPIRRAGHTVDRATLHDNCSRRGYRRDRPVNSLAGQFGQTNYAAAKAGMIGFTKALALESAARGITVNVIAAGYTDTAMVAAVPPEILEKIVARIPVGRLARSAEIASAVMFLVSDGAAFITGETLCVNGGQYLQ
ncbi:MAG: SDR family oxidoreductase [Gammaproteobacteria bacterium]|nr:MAG: SDR family oxidoreductase [Gammaproteobacteria bacterium]TLZ46938.1 MAG: SDR family oxidoreductase [Gammaproteobacteria bacterium]